MEELAVLNENKDSASDAMCAFLVLNISSLQLIPVNMIVYRTKYGPDSRTGLLTSIMMSCTETCFYTMSVYYMAAKVKKTRWTLAGAVFATAVGILASAVIVWRAG